MRLASSVILSSFVMSCFLLTGAANACVINPAMVLTASGKLRLETYKEQKARERKYTKIAIRKNLEEAKLALATGKVDVAQELTSLLIPIFVPRMMVCVQVVVAWMVKTMLQRTIV